jgi:hypothetical protein
MGYFTDPSTGDKSGSRFGSILSVIGAILLACYLAYRGQAEAAVTLMGYALLATWGGYTANSATRVIMTRGMPPRRGLPDPPEIKPEANGPVG